MLLFSAVAFAAPDHVAAIVETTSSVADLAVSPDAAFVAFTTTAGETILLDTLSWYYWNVETAETATAGVALGTGWLAVGLSDGTVEIYTLDRYSGPTATLVLDSGAELLGLAADSTYLYVAYSVDDANPSIEGFDVETGESTGDAVTMGASGFVAFGARWASDGTGSEGEVLGGLSSALYVVIGNDDVGRVTVDQGVVGSATITQQQEGSHDLTNLWLPIGGYAWFSDNTGNANSVGYQGSDTTDLDLIFPAAPEMGACSAVSGQNTGDNKWFAAAGTDAVYIYDFSGALVGDETASISDSPGASQLAAIQGYLFAGGGEGLQVLTDRPWVDVTSVDPYAALPGATVTVTFTSDEDGTYDILLQAVGSSATTTAATGSVTAGETTTAEITVPEVDGAESGDLTYLFTVAVDPGDAERVGHDADYFERNAAPEQVTIANDGVLAGDRRIVISFDAFDEADATSYDVYFSTVPFTSSDYTTAGPTFEGPDGTLELPLSATPDEYTGLVTMNLDPVTNGTTYYVGIRAIDESVEGPMSDVVAVTPNETYAVSELLGIESWCGLPLTSAGWLGVALAALVSTRRRRFVAPIVGLLAVGLMLPTQALAKPHEDDLTSRSFDLEFRYGPFLSQADSPLTDAFGTTDNRLLRGDVGWCSNFVEADLGFGLWQDGGALVFGDGTESGDEDTLLAFPLSADATLRLDIWKEQPVVPYVRAGVDLWLWNETWQAEYDQGGGDSVTAGTPGWHWGAGLAILLDGLDLGASSRLETVASVNDTYLVGEFRESYALGNEDEILDFTSSDLTIGLKFDY